MAYPEIEWKFNVPRTPHSGGFFERLIQSFKRAFYATVRQPLRREEFSTVVATIQGALNRRPITRPDPADPDSAEALTPNHFLAGTVVEPFAWDLWNSPPVYDTPLGFMDAVIQSGAAPVA